MEYAPENESLFGGLSNQAQWATGAWVFLMLLVVVLPLRTVETTVGTDGKSVTRQVEISTRQRILIILGLLLPSVINIYSINCMVRGECNVWAWIQTSILLAYVLVVFMMLFA